MVELAGAAARKRARRSLRGSRRHSAFQTQKDQGPRREPRSLPLRRRLTVRRERRESVAVAAREAVETPRIVREARAIESIAVVLADRKTRRRQKPSPRERDRRKALGRRIAFDVDASREERPSRLAQNRKVERGRQRASEESPIDLGHGPKRRREGADAKRALPRSIRTIQGALVQDLRRGPTPKDRKRHLGTGKLGRIGGSVRRATRNQARATRCEGFRSWGFGGVNRLLTREFTEGWNRPRAASKER